MNRLAKTVLFSVKKPNNSRIFTCLVRQKVSQTHAINRSFTKLSFQSKLCDKSYWCSTSTVIQKCRFSSNEPVSQLDYEKYCAETLDDLSDYIEELIESTSELASADVVNKVIRESIITHSCTNYVTSNLLNKYTIFNYRMVF